jgi:hypothetical protein
MRFLVFFILSSFFFIAPFQSKAGVLSEKQSISGIEDKLSATTLIDRSISDDYSEPLIQLNHRHSSTTQYRLFPFTNFKSTLVVKRGIELIQNEKYFIQPYLYCKRLGLKLIFPEHYHW